MKNIGLDHGFGHARAFFLSRQELAIAQTSCRDLFVTPVWPNR
jgi:hypothetical protein